MIQGAFSLFPESPFDFELWLIFDLGSRIWDFQTSILEVKSSHRHDKAPGLSVLSDDKPLGNLRDTAVEEVLHVTQLLAVRREDDLAAKVLRQTFMFARLVPHCAILTHGAIRKLADCHLTWFSLAPDDASLGQTAREDLWSWVSAERSGFR